MRTNARATRLASMRSLSDAINQYFTTLAEDADLAELWFRGIYDFHSVKDASLMRFSSLMDYLFRSYEDMYYQRVEGHLDPRVWGGFERIMLDIIAYPGIQSWWRSRSHWFSDQFAEFITERQATAGDPSLYGEAHSGITRSPEGHQT